MYRALVLLLAVALNSCSPAFASETYSSASRAFREANPGILASGEVIPAPQAFLARLQELHETQQMIQHSEWVPEEGDHWVISWRGDCEDRALAAHEHLAALGWPRSAMRIMVRLGTKVQIPHAVLCVWIDGKEPLCLDYMKVSPLSLTPGKWKPV